MLKLCMYIMLGGCGVLMCSLCAAAKDGGQVVRFYVATDGNDAWSGKLPQAAESKTDGPFATLERARDEIRKLTAAQGLPPGGVVVIVRAGTYALNAPFELGAEDSGTAESRIFYTAFPGEEVRISGGKRVTEFSPVTDPETLELLDASARGKVLWADLKALGIADFGPPLGGGLEVFFRDDPQTLARWPNEGFVRISGLAVDDGHKIHGIPGSTVGKFYYEGDRPKRWAKEKDPWLSGYWFWDWSQERQRVESIDTEKRIVSLVPPYHGYGYRKGQWYYAFNLLSELDVPGEWYVDREKGILYFWPPAPVDSGSVVVSILPNLVTLKDACYVTLHGFTFEAARGTAVVVSGGHHDEVARCVIRNVGGGGVDVSGESNGVTGCEIYRTGNGGISLSGGDRKTLTPGNLYAVNNHIHDYARVNRMYQSGIAINGVGLRAAHNLIHTAPHMAIQFGGNDHVIEYNEIHDVCFESNDAGAIYAGRDWTMRGNVIRHNYFHHISGFENRGCVGVYLDDMFASAAIYGNVFYKVTSAAFIGGGRDCSVENNIFVDCKPALHVDARALGWAFETADNWIKEEKEKGTLSGIAYKEPPYSTRYPQLPKILDGEPKAPEGNTIARNICWGGKWDDVEDKARKYLHFEDNLLDQDPRFVDPDNLDFRLKENSPAFKIGFKPIPIGDIGPNKGTDRDESTAARLDEEVLSFPEVAARNKAGGMLSVARRYREENDCARARECYKQALKMKELAPADRLNVLLELGHVAVQAHDYASARKAFSRLAKMECAPAYFRSIARLCLAESCARDGKPENAGANYHKVASMPDAPRHHQWEAEDRLREIERVETGKPERDPAENRVKLPEQAAPALTFYVSPQGSDGNPGSIEKPFATFQRAQEEVVARKKQGGLPKGGVEIRFREGVYKLSEGLTIRSEASGTEEAPVVYCAHEKEKPRFVGGVQVAGFQPVDDAAILARLPKESRGKVVQADLKAQGIADFGTLEPRGFGCKVVPPTIELYFNGKPMQPARWPNEGFVRTGKVIEPGSMLESRGAIFEYDGDRPARWKQAHDVWLYGYWYYDWADNAIGVTSIDPATHRSSTAHTSPYGMQAGQPYYAYNLLEEIDVPGEWYLDRANGILYLYPPSDPAAAVIEISMVNGPLVRMDKASHVTLSGLTFELGRSQGIVIEGGDHCLVAGCTLSRLAGDGVVIDGGAAHGVFGCDLHTLGRGGTVVSGGNRKTLEPGGHFVENCHVYDFSRIDRTYTPAVLMNGCGNRIAHNLFHDSPCHAIRLEGNDHIVEFNDVHDVVRESDDQGGLDMFLNPAYRGNILRYNFWHDIGSGRACGQAGIRLDDAISGTLIYGNVFQRCSVSQFGGVQIHGGKDNWVDNNIFVDCKFGVSLSQWGAERWKKFLESDTVKKFLQEVDVTQPPYSVRYPELSGLSENPDVNMIWRNLLYNCGPFLTRDRGIEALADNYIAEQDPGFINAASGDFQLKKGAAAFDKLGLRPIPFDEMGLYEHPLRASWPVEEKK
jgi:hypothetical protein